MDHSALKVRLYLEHPLGAGQALVLDRTQAHYLFNVMRLDVGAQIAVFNGRDGAWRAEVAARGKRNGRLTCHAQIAPQRDPPDLWLLFAPIRKARTDFIVEKATELGAARILPVTTDFTNAERIRQDRLQAHAIEAAEQCGGTYVPPVAALKPLAQALADWPAGRALVWADEALADTHAARPAMPPAPAAVLIGPEGGFSDRERARLRAMAATCPVALGPRVLRADTAAVAALTLWQMRLGDWT